jgi:hypothetical protein
MADCVTGIGKYSRVSPAVFNARDPYNGYVDRRATPALSTHLDREGEAVHADVALRAGEGVVVRFVAN